MNPDEKKIIRTPQEAQQAAIDAAEELAQSAFDNYLIQQDYGTNYIEELFPIAPESRDDELDPMFLSAPSTSPSVQPSRPQAQARGTAFGSSSSGSSSSNEQQKYALALLDRFLEEHGKEFPGLAAACSTHKDTYAQRAGFAGLIYTLENRRQPGSPAISITDFAEEDITDIYTHVSSVNSRGQNANALRRVYRSLDCLKTTPAAKVIAESPTLNQIVALRAVTSQPSRHHHR